MGKETATRSTTVHHGPPRGSGFTKCNRTPNFQGLSGYCLVTQLEDCFSPAAHFRFPLFAVCIGTAILLIDS